MKISSAFSRIFSLGIPVAEQIQQNRTIFERLVLLLYFELNLVKQSQMAGSAVSHSLLLHCTVVTT
jgi:hypothetical protein